MWLRRRSFPLRRGNTARPYSACRSRLPRSRAARTGSGAVSRVTDRIVAPALLRVRVSRMDSAPGASSACTAAPRSGRTSRTRSRTTSRRSVPFWHPRLFGVLACASERRARVVTWVAELTTACATSHFRTSPPARHRRTARLALRPAVCQAVPGLVYGQGHCAREDWH